MQTSKIMMLTAVLTILWGCSSDNGDSPSTYTFEASEKPAWSVNMVSSDADPGWQDIDRTLYESWMYVTVKLQDELARYAGDGDFMTVFIGDEQRTKPAEPNIYEDGSVYFVMTIGGNSTEREINIRLCYWCAKLRQLFTIEEKTIFTPELPYGNTSDYVPPLLKGSKKYPVQQQLTVNLPAEVPFTPADGDIVAAFAGNECRGVGSIGNPFTVFSTASGETFQLRYYSSAQAGVYSFRQNVTLSENDPQSVTLIF